MEDMVASSTSTAAHPPSGLPSDNMATDRRHNNTTTTKMDMAMTIIITGATGRTMDRTTGGSTKTPTMREVLRRPKKHTDLAQDAADDRCPEVAEDRFTVPKLPIRTEAALPRREVIPLDHLGEACPTGRPDEAGCVLAHTDRTQTQQLAAKAR
ncbi:hypothetical protein QQZ08_006693 [Neonectria magnoliae]|uniref:Uncharacterized protein n=1 Tax=Neonectria magnoliae TaxID=2732573 RepID=A0ABR1I048_9HYPO